MRKIFAEEQMLTWSLAEEIVIASVCFQPSVLAKLDEVEAGDFAHPGHRCIFGAIRDVQCAGEDVDVVAIMDAVERVDRHCGTTKAWPTLERLAILLERHNWTMPGDLTWCAVGAAEFLRKLRHRRERLVA